MKKLYWLLLGVPLLVGVASYSIAQPGGGQRGGGRMGGGRQGFAFWKMENVVEELAITPDQVQQLEDIDYKFQIEGVASDGQLKKARLEFDHLLSQDTYPEQDIGRLVDEITAGSSERIKLGLNRQIAVRKVLTPEQWSQIKQMRGNRSRKMKMRMGKGRKGGSRGGRGMGRSDQDEGGEG